MSGSKNNSNNPTENPNTTELVLCAVITTNRVECAWVGADAEELKKKD